MHEIKSAAADEQHNQHDDDNLREISIDGLQDIHVHPSATGIPRIHRLH